MKRIIKDFKNLTDEVIAMMEKQYPTGYTDSQLVSFVNAKGEFVKAIEVRGDDVIYLIKVDRQLDKHLSEQEDDDLGADNDFDSSDDAEDLDIDGSNVEDPSDDD